MIFNIQIYDRVKLKKQLGKNCRVVEPNHTYGYYREIAIH